MVWILGWMTKIKECLNIIKEVLDVPLNLIDLAYS
jgi:hypothetical protein